MYRYATTIFLSAFLLFQVQPLIGKLILPWFGGTSAVWTTCMLFFQVVLLCGYAYAHFISSRLSPRAMTMVHLALLAASLWFLPISPNPSAWQTAGSAMPVGRILLLLAGTIGLPYFLLSSTGPLLQESYRRETGLAPYRLYSLSNIGSLLALLSYPFVFEPQLKLWTQILIWSVGYAVFAFLSGVCAWKFARLPEPAVADPSPAQTEEPYVRPQARQLLLWLALSACGSVMLLATTNQLTQEVPPVPFLWIAPLALYLLSFIICFDRERWYHRGVFLPLLVAAVGLSGYALLEAYSMPLWQQITIYPGAMFICCMICHGELVRTRPAPRHATLFYLLVSAGGALGGILVAIGAPLLLPDYWEYQIGLVATVGLAFVAIFLSSDPRAGLARWGWIACGLAFTAASVAVVAWPKDRDEEELSVEKAVTRNFYGVLRVTDRALDEPPEDRWRLLTNGRISHGVQYHDPEKRRLPTTYYTPHSGVGMAINHHPTRFSAEPADQALRIGVVGLGAGTLAANARAGDFVLFYEINPQVYLFSREYFKYLSESPARIDLTLGDARIQMQRQLDEGNPQQFDVLAIDAFSSDAIPVHLLTRESVELYFQHLKPDGILCLHISNLYLDLDCVVRGIAAELDYPCELIDTDGTNDFGEYRSTWALLTRNEAFLEDPDVVAAIDASDNSAVEQVVWTDDYASLWQVLKEVRKWREQEEDP